MEAVLAILLTLLLQGKLPEEEGSDRDSPGLRTFAVVFSVRGSAVGADAGQFGVFVRQPGERTWTMVMRSNVFTFGLARFNHHGTNRLYVAAGNGVHRSTDGGRSWRITTSWETMEILSVVPDSVDSATVYAATPWGVFKTTDDGAVWLCKDKGFRRWFVQKLMMDPVNRSVLFAAAEDDLYRTTNSGDSWEPLHVGASQVLTAMQSRRNPAFLAVGIEDGGVRISRDGGRQWTAVREIGLKSIYDISESPDGARLFAAGWQTGLWVSEDEGGNWRQLWADPDVDAIFTVRVDPRDKNHLAVGTDGQGVYESADGGRSWMRGGLPGGKVKQIEFYP